MTKLEQVNTTIQEFYQQELVSERLAQAILYSVNAGGKRVRPLALLETLEGFGVTLTEAHYQVAAALEMIHTGSLIHDDLPAMDNDDYRRGQLTNHKTYDEATAILAGDSLFLDPFGLLAQTELPAEQIVALVNELSRASGTFGMVGGQMLDILGEGQELDLDALYAIHKNKTGKLLSFPFVAAGILADQDARTVQHLRQVGFLVGSAFQIRDDILDMTANFEELGKTPQKDQAADKSTYPKVLGLDRSYQILESTLDQAKEILEGLQETANFEPSKVLAMLEELRLNA